MNSKLLHPAKLFSIIIACISVVACQTTGTKTNVTSGSGAPDINQVKAQSYNGPQARIAVSSFKDKSNNRGWYNKEIGDGMADQLTTALVNSGRFIVLERQALSHVLGEQDLATSGRISQQTAAPIGKIEGAEILVVAAVTEFDANSGGTSASGGGWVSGLLGAVKGGMKNSHIAIDLRLIDAKTSRILAATSVEGESTDSNIGGAVLGWFGGGVAGVGLNSWKNTPKEKALRSVINNAVEYILTKVPPTYYRHGNVTTQTNSSKTDVKMAQGVLNCLGFKAGTRDGLIGKGTASALKAYQKLKGLSVSGKLNMATLNSLKQETCSA